MAKHTSGQVAADALRWVAKGGKAPDSIKGASTVDQAKLAKAAAGARDAIKR